MKLNLKKVDIKKVNIKKDPKMLIAVAAIIVLLVVVVVGLVSRGPELENVSDGIELTQCDETNEMRVCISPIIKVEDGRLSAISFSNMNADRYMKVKIKQGKKTIYESPYVKSGKILMSDRCENTDDISNGKSTATAKIYTYDKSKNQIGHSEVKIILLKD